MAIVPAAAAFALAPAAAEQAGSVEGAAEEERPIQRQIDWTRSGHIDEMRFFEHGAFVYEAANDYPRSDRRGNWLRRETRLTIEEEGQSITLPGYQLTERTIQYHQP